MDCYDTTKILCCIIFDAEVGYCQVFDFYLVTMLTQCPTGPYGKFLLQS